MRILFVNSMLGQCGGITNILQIAKGLSDMGHEIYVRYPYSKTTSNLRKMKRLSGITLRSAGILKQREVNWMDASGLDIKIVPSLKEKYMPDADATIFSWWENAYDVRNYSSKKGEKFYYAQHYETLWGGTDPYKIDATYRMGFHILTNSAWVEKQINALGVKCEGIVYPGVCEKFYPIAREYPEKGFGPIIGTPYRDWGGWKGYLDVLEAIEIVKVQYPKLILKTYGLKQPPAQDTSIFSKGLSDEELCEWYNSCSVFVYASWYDGYASPPMEAMRCKVPTCSTQVGVLDDFHDYCGAFLSPPRDPKTLASNILLVLNPVGIGPQIALKVREAYEFACQFTWEKAAKSILIALEEKIKR